MRQLDRDHITFALLDNALAPAFSARPADFGNLSQLLGTDPYDYVNSSFTTNLSNEVANLRNMQQGFETLANGSFACFEVTQMQLYPCWHCPAPPVACACEYPKLGPLRAMAFMAAIVAQSSGILLYAYYRVLGYPDPPLPPAVVDDRLLEHAHAWSAVPRGVERAARPPA